MIEFTRNRDRINIKPVGFLTPSGEAIYRYEACSISRMELTPTGRYRRSAYGVCGSLRSATSHTPKPLGEMLLLGVDGYV
jgi:hypothetical protein